MERPVHISTHIEKTAGTSLQEFYTRFYGPKRVYIYSSDSSSLVCADRLIMRARVNVIVDKIRFLSKHLGLTSLAHTLVLNHLLDHPNNHKTERLPKNCLVVHGHFVADKFDEIVKNPFRTVVLREPLERMISHYKYWKEAKGVTNHRIDMPFDERMSFVDFSSQKCLRNFQTNAFGSLTLSDFDLVGVTQDLKGFVDRFIRLSKNGKDVIENLRRLNASPYKNIDYNQLGIDDNFIRMFKKENELDYLNYNHVLEMNKTN